MQVPDNMKPVEGYEELYGITPTGKVYSFKAKRYLKIWESAKFNTVLLCNYAGRKRKLVHRMVAEAYIENPAGLPFVIHINDKKKG